MKAMFVDPPVQSAIQSRLGATGIPSSAYLAPILEEEGHEVKIVDTVTMGYDLEDVKAEIKRFDPELLGATSVTPTIYSTYEIAKIAKELNSDCITVVGGPHPTFAAKRIVEECPYIDVAVRGEGEETLKELVSTKELDDIKGITYRKGDRIVENKNRPFIQDLDSLPFPAYHLLPMDKYELGGFKYATMMTSRGCPFNCIFCSSSGICGKAWRGNSPDRVLEQIKLLVSEHGISEIEMLDDTFLFDNKRARNICDLIIEEGLDVSWSCSSRVDTITKPLAEKLKEAGCHTIYMGIESGSQKILNRLRKGVSIEQIKKAVKIVKEAGLDVFGSFVLGVPGETKRLMEKTVDFAKKLRLTFAQFTLLTPYPGTEAYEIAERDDLFLTKDWSQYTTLDPVMKISKMTAEEIKGFLTKAYLSFYLRPSYIWDSIKGRRFWGFLKALLNKKV